MPSSISSEAAASTKQRKDDDDKSKYDIYTLKSQPSIHLPPPPSQMNVAQSTKSDRRKRHQNSKAILQGRYYQPPRPDVTRINDGIDSKVEITSSDDELDATDAVVLDTDTWEPSS